MYEFNCWRGATHAESLLLSFFSEEMCLEIGENV